MKKILSVLFAVLMICCSVPLAGFMGVDFPGILTANAEETTYGGNCGDNLTWSLDTVSGELVISGTGDMWNYPIPSLNLPWYSYSEDIKTVVICDGVTSIGECAFFWCHNLTSVIIPYSVTCICDLAFFGCDNLASVIIPDSVTSIGDSAFSSCDSIKNITISDNVISIGSGAFGSCNSLESITVDPSNTEYSSDENGVLFNKDKTELLQYPTRNRRKNFIIPDSVTTIDGEAFFGCKTLASVIIPDSVTNIAATTFYGCSNLTDVKIGIGVTDIGMGAFAFCTKLLSVTIPDSVTSFGDYAFAFCSSLESAKIGNNVTSIGERVFQGCGSLKNITIGNGVTSIGMSAFAECTSLKNLTIPHNVTSIGAMAFAECTSLKNLTIPHNVTSIGAMAFSNCTSLENLTIPGSVSSIYSASFGNCTNLKSLKISEGVTTIVTLAFSGCTNLSSVTIPKTVEEIGYGAFYSCSNIKDVYYGGSRAEWEEVIIGAENTSLTSARIHYNSTGPVGGDSPENPDTPDYDADVLDKFLVATPSQSSVSYGDSLVLHMDSSKIPAGGYVEWYASNNNFSYSESADGTTCTITPSKNGDTTFTALVYDEDGNIVSADEQTMTSKAGFFDKIIAFFKKLFGLTKTIPEAYKIIY